MDNQKIDYNNLLEVTVDLGYELAMSGAETYRIEESIYRILKAYGIESEIFAIPNNLLVSIETPEGQPMTRMRRIGQHGNDLDAVERFSGLSRAICNRKPEPQEARKWLAFVKDGRRTYPDAVMLLGDFLGGFGFAFLFGGSFADGICAGICGLIIGLLTKYIGSLQANNFFSTILSSCVMAFAAYAMGAFGIAQNVDAVIIGALMILVPGLLFTNAMRDIIYGDTNSGVNRIVQVFLIAVALALGTGVAWNGAALLWGAPAIPEGIAYSLIQQLLPCLIGCCGFTILFNIHGPGGLLCALGGMLTWVVYVLAVRICGSDLLGYFWGALFASAYSEIMARIRKCPAISYLVVCIFPLIPGAGVYYTMNYAVRGDMAMFANRGMFTAGIAGVMAVGILLISTTVRIFSTRKQNKK